MQQARSVQDEARLNPLDEEDPRDTTRNDREEKKYPGYAFLVNVIRIPTFLMLGLVEILSFFYTG